MKKSFFTSANEIAGRTGSPASQVSIGGNSIFYEVAGEGPPIVFIHDGLLHRRGWDAQFEFFAQEFTVVRYDRPGYGDSKPPLVEYSQVGTLHSLFDFLGIEQALLVGGSAGGGIAIDFALAHPGLVIGLVLVGAPVSGFDFTEHMLNRGWVSPWPETLEEALEYWANDPWLIAEENQAARKRFRDLLWPSLQNLEYSPIPILDDGEALDRLSEIKVPTLIIIGESDIADNHAHSGVIQVGIKGSERKIVSNAGHLVYLERPGEFNQLVMDFLLRRGYPT